MAFRRLSLFFGLMSLGGTLHAASFDCKKATTKSEKTICSSDALAAFSTKRKLMGQR